MSADLFALRRKLLADLPWGIVDPTRVPEFEMAFSASVVEVADTASVILGTVPSAEWLGAVERLVRGLTGAVATAAEFTGVGGHPWISQAQRWAVHAVFDRIAEIGGAMSEGGRA